MDIKIDDELLDEFVMINMIGLYACYKNQVIDVERMRRWLLNGKVSKLLRIKKSNVKNIFETFEEIMRFEALEDRKIIDFEKIFLEFKEILFEEIKKIQKNNRESYFLKFEEEFKPDNK